MFRVCTMRPSKFVVLMVMVICLAHWPPPSMGSDGGERKSSVAAGTTAGHSLSDAEMQKILLANGNGNGNYGNISEFHFLITGGYRPEKNNLVKYVVSVRTSRERKFFGDNHFCGGAVISTTVILTAGHCLYSGTTRIKASRLKVVAGTPRRLQRTDVTQVRDVDAVKPHPKYTPKRLKNDIGLLLLKKALNPNPEFVQIIPLSTATPAAGLKCTVVGWGTVIQFGPTPDEAVNGDVSVNDNSFCSSLEGFGKGMLCASDASDHEVDSCQGDSGGPLMCDDIVVGVVSFGAGCGEPNSAGVYSNVHYFGDWIRTNGGTRHAVAVTLPLLISQLLLLVPMLLLLLLPMQLLLLIRVSINAY